MTYYYLDGLQDSKIRICATDAKSHDIKNMVDVVRLDFILTAHIQTVNNILFLMVKKFVPHQSVWFQTHFMFRIVY